LINTLKGGSGLNSEQIQAFIYVALTGSFSKAGEILYLSQPSVSSRVKALEEEVGADLFTRSGKTVTLSKEGKAFFPYAENILQNVQKGKLSIQSEHTKTVGELAISSVLVASNYILGPVIEQFHQVYPKIKLNVYTGHSHDVLNMVLNHEVAFGISRSVNHPQIETIHLMDDEMVLVIYPTHPFASKEKISIDDVAKEPLILFNRGSIDWTLIHGSFNSLDVEPNVVMELDSIGLSKIMVKKKLGIAILPRFAIEDELKEKTLQVVPIVNFPQIRRDFELIYLKRSTLDGITKLFIDLIIETLKRNRE
jgi:DNA-binding transcriptional LysR family regulator